LPWMAPRRPPWRKARVLPGVRCHVDSDGASRRCEITQASGTALRREHYPTRAFLTQGVSGVAALMRRRFDPAGLRESFDRHGGCQAPGVAGVRNGPRPVTSMTSSPFRGGRLRLGAEGSNTPSPVLRWQINAVCPPSLPHGLNLSERTRTIMPLAPLIAGVRREGSR